MDSHDLATSPHISISKQDRILIWRNEVASASPSSPSDFSSNPSAPSLTTTTSTSSLPSSALAALSRGRRFLNKIASRLPGRRQHQRRRSVTSGEHSPGFIMMPPRKDEPVARTAMYRMLAAPGELAAADAVPMDGGEVVSEGASNRGGGAAGGRGGLLETQERLVRAARLLSQGVR